MKLFSSLENSVFYRQVRVLSTKNWLLSKRNFKGTIGQLIAPFIIVVMLFGFQKLSNYVLSRDNPYPTPYQLGNYPKCIERNNVECITIMYAPNNTEWVNTLMEVVSLRAGLEFGKDVVGVGHGNLTQMEAIVYDNATIYTHIVDNQNLTQNALIFWGAYLGDLFPIPMTPSGLPVDVGYLLWYNMTADNPYSMELMRLIDETVLLLQQNLSRKDDIIPQDKTYVKASYSPFPVQKLRFAGYDVVAANGGVWFYIPPMITFFILLTELVMEKENHLRIGMRVMGLQNSAYWVVWFITGFIFVLLSTLILIATGSIFQFSFFLNSNFFALFLLFFFFGMAMLSLCFLISTFVESSKTAQTIGYAFILVGFVFQVILCSMNGALIDLLYAKEVHTWVKFIRMVFTLYPPFNLAMGFSNIAAVSSDVINIAAGMITSGPGFRFSDLFVRRSVPSLFGLHMTVPTPFQTILTLIANSVFFLILTWYFDNVISAGQGVSRHPLFFLQAEYWGLTKKGKSNILSNQDQQERIANESALKLSSTDSDVRNEAEVAVKNNRNIGINSSSSSSSNPNQAFSGIRVVGLTKVYHPHFSFTKFIKKLFEKLFSKKGEYIKVDVDQKSDEKESDLLAVDNLSIMIEEGQIFSVLGHNGAGKTTTINMLTGLFPPTSGFSYIYGKSILTDMDEIRKMVGVCPQHDILYNELTANEHLRLFAKLKGIENVEQEIKTRLDYMGLSKVGDHRVGSFSGGMKRRLSVAISAIGDPKVIFLDEPTTGMDVVNRASVWTMIQNMKHNRVIVLTTHSMQEADVLSDRISIMSFGKLCAIGSSLHLKNKFGTGYRINAATRIDQVQNITRELTTIIPDMAQGANNAGSVTWHIPVSNRDKMPSALQFLESQDDKTVREWGVACSSLEEVFLDVTKNTGFHYDDIEGESSVVPSDEIQIESENLGTLEAKSHRESTVGKKPPKSNVYRALLRKNFTLQKRQTGTNFCQIITPILVMAILVLLRLIIKSQLGDQANAKVLIPSIPIPINLPLSSIPNINIPSSIPQSEKYFPFFKSLNKAQPSNPFSFNKLFEYKDHFFPVLLPTLPIIPNGNSSINVTFPTDGNCLEFFYFSDSTFNYSAGFLNSTGAGAGLLGEMKSRQTPCILLGGTVVQIPYFEELGTLHDIDKHIFDILGVYNAQPIRSIDYPPFNYMLPDGALDFSYLEPKHSRIDYTFTVNENPIVRYHRKNNFTRVSISFLDLSENEFSIMIPHGQLSLMDLVHQAFANQVLGKALGQSLSLLSLKLCQPMPYFDSADILGLLEAFGTVLYPVALTLQLPIYIYILAMEKSEKLKEMMKQHGMKNSSYIITNYIFDMSLYIVVVSFFWIVGILVNIRFFTQTNWLTLFLVFFGWGNSLISLAFALSTFINSKRAAVILGYVVALFGSLMGIVLVGIYGDIPLISISPRLPVGYLAWPQIAFVRAIYLLNNACALEFSCYGSPALIPKGDEMINVLISLYISPIVYFVLYLYLDQVVRNDFGVPKHPLFFLLPIWNKLKALTQNRSQTEKDNVLLINPDEESSLASSKKILSVKNSNVDLFKGPDSDEDKDIIEERERVYAGNYPPDSPLVIIDLRKEYPPNTPKGAAKIAVSNLTLAVPNGQCFGLLGENGAGKTTAISVLTGLITPTSGKAFVGGFSILNDIDKAQLVMGVCPQFNILWDSLSVREHMLFYARLKGVSPSNELEHVNQMLHELGLLHAANRRASDLSGGMKRRLSVGIALIGYSRIVFLDEPTTGMDIASRRQLWSIINRAKAGRVIILTTHSMEEAELLCDNIGIMALGKLRALGTQQHLKSTLGESYQLQISFKSQDESMATNLVHTLFPGCRLVRSYKGWAQFEIGRDQVRVSDVFARMEKESSQGGILDWGCNQVGLEEVFQRVVYQSNKEKDSDEIEMASF